MDEVESLLAVNPDSSQSLLDDAEFLIRGDKDFARWCLLSGKTEDEIRKIRKPKPLLSVSQWLRAEAYYDKRGTPEEKAHIKMYLGRALCDGGHYDEAVAVYKEGLNLARKAKAYTLSGYLCSLMGNLYLDKDLMTEAAEKYEEAVAFHRQGGNLRSRALALSSLSFCHVLNRQYDTALSVLRQAKVYADTIQDFETASIIINCFGLVYEYMENLELAESYYLQSIEMDKKDQSTGYYNLSILFTQKGDLVKARYYLDKAVSDQTIDVIPYQRYLIEKSENNMDSALFYLEQYQMVLDSVSKEQNKIHVYEVEKKYDKSQLVNERNRLQIHLLRIVVAGLILLIVFTAAFFRYRHYKNRLLRDKQNAVAEKESEYRVLLARLREKEHLLSEKEKQSKKYMQQKQALKNLRLSLFDGKLELIKQSSVGRKIVDISKRITAKTVPLNDRDWSSLEKLIKTFYPDIYALISEATANSSDDSSKLCYLSLFGLRTKEEAFLLGKSDQAIRQNRTRLRKLFNLESDHDLRSRFRSYGESVI
jgi:tetratricopeptide (TPR) repeat protein